MAIALCRILELREEHDARKYVEAAGYEALQDSIPERIGYRRAQNRGQSLTETSEESLNKRARTLMERLQSIEPAEGVEVLRKAKRKKTEPREGARCSS